MICWRSSYSTAARSEDTSSAAHIPCLVSRTPHGADAAICAAPSSARSASYAAGDDVGDQPDAQGLLGVEAPAGEHQLV